MPNKSREKNSGMEIWRFAFSANDSSGIFRMALGNNGNSRGPGTPAKNDEVFSPHFYLGSFHGYLSSFS